MSPKRAALFVVMRQMVFERCGGRCERCGTGLPAIWECHHRKLRSQGGDHSLCNLLALHMSCHNAGVTGSVHHSPGKAYRHGYLVHGWAEPRTTPVLLHRRRWVLLTADGHYRDTDPPEGES